VRYKYDPENPLASPNGMVTIDDYYAYLSFKGGMVDNRMFNGNEPVVLRFISDAMPPTRHPCNEKMYESKKRFRDETKARGCVEVGNNVEGFKRKQYIQPSNRKDRRDAIKRSIDDLKNNRLPKDDMDQIKKHSEAVDFINRNRTRKA
jgi:hypothetical protein